MHAETGGAQGDPGIEDRDEGEGALRRDVGQVTEEQSERGADGPGQRRIEDEAGLSGTEGGAVSPPRVKVAVGDLAGRLEPADEMEAEVVSAGAAV